MMGIRADRIATVYFFHPLRQIVRPAEPRIPILMYHSISGADEGAKHAYYRIATDPVVFASQLQFLHDHGYTPVGLREAVRVVEGSAPGPKKPVVLTFDDGYQDFYTTAFPILSRFGYSATMFLPTAYIGQTAGDFKGSRCLTWSQVRELHRAGMEFGSHTVSHPQLSNLKMPDVEEEVRCSKDRIEEQLGYQVESFSYPFAFPETDRMFRERLRAVLEGAGYMNGVSTILGTAARSSDRFFMERLPVNSADDARFLGAKLEGAYDWLHGLQYAYKRTKGSRRDA